MTTTTLASKIAAASKDVGGKLATDKTNTQQNYGYISADKMLAVCGQALADQGVVIFPSITDSATTKEEGSKRHDARVSFVFTVTDGVTQLELPFVGYGSDYAVPDKAIYKAITSGHKYFIAKLLTIGAGNEDGEHEVEAPPAGVASQRTAPAPKAPQQAPEAPQTGNGNGQHAALSIDFIESELTRLHRTGQPASEKAYGYLAGLIDGLTAKNEHGKLLGQIIGREVSKENPPSKEMVMQLINWLAKTKKQGEQTVPNPDYRQEAADWIIEMWVAQPELA